MRKKFAQNLKKYRTQQNISVKEMAYAVGVTPNTIYKWEKGKSAPSLTKLILIVKLLKIRSNVLLGLEKIEN